MGLTQQKTDLLNKENDAMNMYIKLYKPSQFAVCEKLHAFPRIFPMDSHGISARCSCSLPATSRRCWSGWSLNDLDLAVGTSAPTTTSAVGSWHKNGCLGAPIFMFHGSRCSGKYGVATDWTQKRLMLLRFVEYLYGKALLSSQISWWCFNG